MSPSGKASARDGRSFARRLGVANNASFEERKQMVLRAAAQAFSEGGFSRTSIDDIAASLGVSKRTIYHYGKSKNELVRACLELGSTMLKQSLAEFAAQYPTGRQKIEAMFDRVTRHVTQDFLRLFVRIDPNDLDDRTRDEYIRMRRDFMRSVVAFVREGVADGSLIADDPELAAYTLIGAYNFVGQWYQPGGRLTPEAVSQGTMRIFLDGLRGPAEALPRAAAATTVAP